MKPRQTGLVSKTSPITFRFRHSAAVPNGPQPSFPEASDVSGGIGRAAAGRLRDRSVCLAPRSEVWLDE